MPATVIDKHCRIILFASALAFNCGLLVSGVLGLRALADLQIQAPEGDAGTPWMPRRFIDVESRIWTELSLSLLTQDQRFLQVGA
jgi:twitching motility protein PilI